MTYFNPGSQSPSGSAINKPSAAFRQQVMKVVGCIALFFLTYILLLLIAVALAAACVAGGVALISALPKIPVIILGAGVIILGVMVLFFLLKFLFSRKQPANPYRTQIHAETHPRLFAFIRQLVRETRIRSPRKVFVVPDVNAAVFYNSSFLSLFWPVRKNLEIGLGLVNTVNVSEFKMVLAHEFGHFSQRSMKLGSYVYGLNRMLYNMLYENEGWNDLVIQWSRIGTIFHFFARITIWIVHSIQFLLRRMYGLINRQYMELSREMEFHADAVAVSLAGTAASISGLRRVEMGSLCLEHCMHKIPELAEKALRFRNVYKVQHALVRYYAVQNRIALDDQHLPLITDDYFRGFIRSRVQLRDQWASHPAREAREIRYRQADIHCAQVNDSAWQLFNEPEHLQESMTHRVYQATATANEPFNWLSPETFINDLQQRQRMYEFPQVFNEYYDNRSFSPTTPAHLVSLTPEELTQYDLASLYAADVVWRVRCFYRDQQDAETLQAIAGGQFQTKYFEFDGQKYSIDKARQLSAWQAAQVQQEEEWLNAYDLLVFRYHYTLSLKTGEQTAFRLLEKYHDILLHQENANQLSDQVISIVHSISELFNTRGLMLEEAQPYFEALAEECRSFKTLLAEIMSTGQLLHSLPPALQQSVRALQGDSCTFIVGNVPQAEAIRNLHETCSAVMEHFNHAIVLLKKEYLEFLLTLEQVPAEH